MSEPSTTDQPEPYESRKNFTAPDYVPDYFVNEQVLPILGRIFDGVSDGNLIFTKKRK